MKKKTWTIVAAVVVGVVLVWLVVWRASPRVPVDAVPVTVGPIEEFVDERAITRLPETYLITMPYAGRIESISLTEGTAVKKGEVVARIVPLDLDLTVKEATAVVERLEAAIRENADTSVENTAVEQALQFVASMADTVKMAAERVTAGEERHKYAEKNLGRVQKLFDENKVRSEEDLDRAKLDYVEASVDYAQDRLVLSATESMKLATDLLPTMIRQYIDRKGLTGAVLEKEKAEAEARLRQVEEDYRRGTMTSPVDGVILARHATNERFLNAGTTLLEIGRLEDLEVEADILSLDVVDAKTGDHVEIYGPAIGRPRASGTVTRIYPAGFTKISSLGVEQQRVKVIIDFDPDDLRRLLKDRGLGVGYRVRVRIITKEKSNASVIPRSALFRGSDGTWQVYAVRDGRAKIVNVRIGMLNDEQAEVIDGLKPDEPVILAPESNLTDGQAVKVTTTLTQ